MQRGRDQLAWGRWGSMPIYNGTTFRLNRQWRKDVIWLCSGILNQAAETASRNLAMERGEAPDAQGTGIRNCHLLAVAPNASSSIICGNTSPSIEPYRANAYTQKTKSGTSLQKTNISKIFSET